MVSVPDSHPRKASLDLRHRLTDGLDKGITDPTGLIAHGRGEAFDYLLGERTSFQAAEAEKVAAAMLLAAEKPVISVNGNTAALCPKEVVELAELTGSKIDVNLFYRNIEREESIREVLEKAGAKKVYGVGVEEKTVPGLDSERAKSDEGILEADAVLVMLEDGDRTEHLVAMNKKVIAIDLNPLSRTAQKAHISVVDNVVRAIPNIIGHVRELRDFRREKLNAIVDVFDNEENLRKTEELIRKGVKP